MSKYKCSNISKHSSPILNYNYLCSDLVRSNTKRLSELDEMIRKMIFEKMGVEKYFDELMNSTSYAIGLMKYRVPKPGEANVGMYPHTDKVFTGILSQNQSNGLQVQMKNGQWIDVEYSSPDSFIFLVSDCLTVSALS